MQAGYPEAFAGLVTALVFKTGEASEKALGGFDSHPLPLKLACEVHGTKSDSKPRRLQTMQWPLFEILKQGITFRALERQSQAANARNPDFAGTPPTLINSGFATLGGLASAQLPL